MVQNIKYVLYNIMFNAQYIILHTYIYIMTYNQNPSVYTEYTMIHNMYVHVCIYKYIQTCIYSHNDI